MTKAKPERSGAKRGSGSANPLGPNTALARKLKEYYDELITSDVPDRFSQLLAQLERTETEPKKD